MNNFFLFLLISVILLHGCKDNKNTKPENISLITKETLKTKKRDSVKIAEVKRPKTEDDFLMIINFIPFNSSYKFIQQLFPEVSELNVKYRRYYKAYFKTTIFNKETTLEFNFSTDYTLLNFGFNIYQLDFEEADSLYKELQKYYSHKFGKYKEEINKNPGSSGYPIYHGSYWKSDEFDITVGLNENFDNCILGWGFQ